MLWPRWEEIEKDLECLGRTGNWPNRKIPSWASQVAKELHCLAASWLVLDAAKTEIIRQLKAQIGSGVVK